MSSIFLRELRIKDAETSYLWRNNPLVWRLTGKKPDREITLDIETKWLDSVIKRTDEKRYAICVSESGQYIGNVQLTNICNRSAEFHIFIGDTSYWGMGIGKEATREMLCIGFTELHLKQIFLIVRHENVAAYKTYLAVGFVTESEDLDYIKMTIKREDYQTICESWPR
ncbi:MAG: GNAT family N-acetyltransferase [Proteobacteria bacterium]|nr:GNAT family N-acetyltransferase [Pseudomonadota bacterium]